MAYKDKDKQRKATRERVKRYRAKLKGVTYKPECNAQGVTPKVTPRFKPHTEPIKVSVLLGDKPDVESYYHKRLLSGIPRLRRVEGLPQSVKQWTGPLTKEKQTSPKGFND